MAKLYYPGTKRLIRRGDHVRIDPFPGSKFHRTGIVERYWEAKPLSTIRRIPQYVVQILPDKYQRGIRREKSPDGYLHTMLENTHPID